MSELFLVRKEKQFNHQLLQTVLCFVSPRGLLMVYNAIRLCHPPCKEHCHNMCKRNVFYYFEGISIPNIRHSYVYYHHTILLLYTEQKKQLQMFECCITSAYRTKGTVTGLLTSYAITHYYY
jgi:hypothetical protein